MNEVLIKRVTAADTALLQAISERTFREAFSAMNSEENMNAYVAESLNKEKLDTEINTTGSEFYLAMLNDDVIGYLKTNSGPAQTEPMQDDCFEIERIYVLQQYHGRQVAQVLFAKAMELAKDKDADYIWLGVWEDNQRAISFYRKNGFEAFGKHIFMLGDDEQTDILMKLRITG